MAWPGRLASRDIRRLQLAAEAGDNVCVLFRERRFADQNSPAALRLEQLAFSVVAGVVVLLVLELETAIRNRVKAVRG